MMMTQQIFQKEETRAMLYIASSSALTRFASHQNWTESSYRITVNSGQPHLVTFVRTHTSGSALVVLQDRMMHNVDCFGTNAASDYHPWLNQICLHALKLVYMLQFVCWFECWSRVLEQRLWLQPLVCVGQRVMRSLEKWGPAVWCVHKAGATAHTAFQHAALIPVKRQRYRLTMWMRAKPHHWVDHCGVNYCSVLMWIFILTKSFCYRSCTSF
jgi:hypothetical protein